jgi:hypothetical protein
LKLFSTVNKKVRLVGIRLSNLEKAPNVAQTTLINFLEV